MKTQKRKLPQTGGLPRVAGSQRTRKGRAAILVALRVEYEAVRAHFDQISIFTDREQNSYRIGCLSSNVGAPDWDILLAQSTAGNVEAAILATKVISSFAPDVVLFVGVAGGLKPEVRHGDVIVASQAFYYESAKVSDQIHWRPKVGRPTPRLLHQATFDADETNWLARIQPAPPNPAPRVHIEPIVAGEKVVANSESDLAKFIRQHVNRAVAVEMEAHGFLEAIYNSGVEGLVVRGISDLLDDKNSTTSAGSDHNRQRMAASHAASFALEVLSNFRPQNAFSTALPQTIRFQLTLEANLPHDVAQGIANKILNIFGGEVIELLHIEAGSTHLTFSGLELQGYLLDVAHKAGILGDILRQRVATVELDSDARIPEHIKKLGDLILELGSLVQHFADTERSRRQVNLILNSISGMALDSEAAVQRFCLEVLQHILRNHSGSTRDGLIQETSPIHYLILTAISQLYRSYARDRKSYEGVLEFDNLNLSKLTIENLWLPNCEFRGSRFNGSSIRNCNFTHSGFERCFFDSARIEDVNMSNGNLRNSRFVNAVFNNTVLRGADMTNCAFNGASLVNIQLQDARLVNADLRRAILTGAVLNRAVMDGARVHPQDFGQASTVGVDTQKIAFTPLRPF